MLVYPGTLGAAPAPPADAEARRLSALPPDATAWNAALGAATRRLRVPTDAPAYHHSFAVTGRHV
ncbi:hypothetical protein OFN60_29720, partial [Escherichia coli]|nr:hypothetical protein [Escherichia coli]